MSGPRSVVFGPIDCRTRPRGGRGAGFGGRRIAASGPIARSRLAPITSILYRPLFCTGRAVTLLPSATGEGSAVAVAMRPSAARARPPLARRRASGIEYAIDALIRPDTRAVHVTTHMTGRSDVHHFLEDHRGRGARRRRPPGRSGDRVPRHPSRRPHPHPHRAEPGDPHRQRSRRRGRGARRPHAAGGPRSREEGRDRRERLPADRQLQPRREPGGVSTSTCT